MAEWAIDTSVVVTCSTSANPLCLAAARLLHAILEDHQVLLDPEGQILREYNPYVSQLSHAAVWWAQMNKLGKFVYRSSKLPAKVTTRLEQLRFDPSDCKFVGVALRSQDHLLVAQESDYFDDHRVTSYIKNDLGISLFDIQRAIASLHIR